jgi:glycosyltransferase involved in cell wall biosynthesis
MADLDVSGVVTRVASAMKKVRDTSQPIRVLRVIARMNVGGPAWQVSVLTRGLEDDQFTSQLVCGEISEGEADFLALRDSELPVTRIRTLGRSLNAFDDVRAFWQLLRIMRKTKPHIVHTHTAKAGVLGRIAAIFTRVPVRVHTFHGHVLHGYFSPLVTRVFIQIERVLGRFTHGIVSVGSQVRDDLLAVGIGTPEKYTVIAPGVASSEPVSKDGARESLELPPDAHVALFIGRLTQIKRPDRLLEAFSLVLEKDPSAVLLMAGEGELFEGTKVLGAHLGDSVRFLGWRSDLAVLFAAADVAVLSSDNEGMPVTLIEASMAGVPCVTTDVGSAREVVLDNETGFVVPTDSVAIAQALVTLFTNEQLRHEMGDAATRHTMAHFSSTRLVKDHVDLYRRLIGQ